MQHHSGLVISGNKNGRKFGFPTANIQLDNTPIINKGSYAVWVEVKGKRHKGMLYVGTRPTLKLKELTFEIHIFDFHQNIYGEKISFSIVKKIRDEKRFKDTNTLIAQLKEDKKVAKEILANPRRRLASKKDIPDILKLIGQGRKRLASSGVDQWQGPYPNEEAILNDIAQKQGHVYILNDTIVAYAAIVFEDDPYYKNIDGKWLSDNPYVVIHRIAVHDDYTHRGVARSIFQSAEKIALRRNISAFRIDTHLQNHYMRNLIRNYGFTLCGIVQVRDGKRLAYEKAIQVEK